jgi:hypothetical protein
MAKVTPIAGKPSLPDSYKFEFLGALCESEAEVADALSADPNGAPQNPRKWFEAVDSLLRSSAKPDELAKLAHKLQQLRASWVWDAFLVAAARDAREATLVRRRHGRMRSLWGVTPIISLINCVAADRSLGVEAESLVLTTYYTTNNFDIDLTDHYAEIHRAYDENTAECLLWIVLLWAMFSYDIFYLYNDRGILSPRTFTGRYSMGIEHQELILLRKSGKLIYTMPYGADYRTRQITIERSQYNFCMDCPTIGEFCFCNSEVWPVVLDTIRAYATAMLASGLSIHHLPGARRLDFVVIDTAKIKPSYNKVRQGERLRVLHVPNHPHFKGTRYLQSAIDRLEAEGAPVDFKLASGISNKEVLQLMSESHLVVDQLIGGHFGQTSLEAMALGKPVIVYLSDPKLLVAPEECPLINANPETIYEVLRAISEKPAHLDEVAVRSRRYVENHYSVHALAERLASLYYETAGIRMKAAA